MQKNPTKAASKAL